MAIVLIQHLMDGGGQNNTFGDNGTWLCVCVRVCMCVPVYVGMCVRVSCVRVCVYGACVRLCARVLCVCARVRL